jgi:hypothetical protein
VLVAFEERYEWPSRAADDGYNRRRRSVAAQGLARFPASFFVSAQSVVAPHLLRTEQRCLFDVSE